ncbi:cytochrome b subunit of succinate dehydrogenase, Sdh3p [Ceratobasidium sp. 394]|nr:cytochrome b subunit of succinate dehydrogenase, Sdh3p [Ceratobasidium sp. 394]KAG9083239.1 cytochrome b subunit of succinate dehydrogenase, Sdh3p [Ceratobasidium sp. UAMH 11750]
MIASRVGLALRRQPLSATKLFVSHSRATPLARQLVRSIQTESLPPSAADSILNAQRVRRPSSPHFTIYRPQITWIGSIANRATGVGVAVLLYGFSLAYLGGPVVGAPIDSASIIGFVASLPEWFKYATKGAVGMAFSYHSWNGIRHLLWDAGKLMSNQAVMRSGWVVVGISAISTVGLLMA